MSFVKLDCGILDSSIWFDRDAREIFITAILMAKPVQIQTPHQQLEVRTLKETGFIVPPGYYGLVAASGSGIAIRSGLREPEEIERSLKALERMGNPEFDSRSPVFEGRRMVRIHGGYLILNYMVYRDKDHTAALRSKRYRLKKSKAARKPKFLSGPLPGETSYVKRLEAGEIDKDGLPATPNCDSPY